MPPRNVDSFVPESLEDELSEAAAQEAAVASGILAKQPPRQLVWRNIIAFVLLHLGALYGIFLIPWAKPATWAWCEYF